MADDPSVPDLDSAPATVDPEQVGSASYKNIWLFGGALAVLVILFVFVLIQYEDRKMMQHILLAALLSALVTGLLGGIGVFKSNWGSVGGAAAILLGMFVTFEGAAMVSNNKKLDALEGEIKTHKSEIEDLTAEMDGHRTELEKTKKAMAALKDRTAGLEIVVYCKTSRHTQQIFLISENDPFSSVAASEPGHLPAVIGLKASVSKRIDLFVAGYRPTGFDQPAEILGTMGSLDTDSVLPGADPAFSVHMRSGAFNQQTSQFDNTKLAIEIHEYDALRKCDERAQLLQ